MPLQVVSGDIFLTRAQTIGVAVATNGRVGFSEETIALGDRYPVFLSDCLRRGRNGRLLPGTIWVWREAQPWIAGLVVHTTPHSAIRLRHVEAAALALIRNWQHEGLHSLALLRLGDDTEWPQVRLLLAQTWHRVPYPVILYDAYQPGVIAPEDLP